VKHPPRVAIPVLMAIFFMLTYLLSCTSTMVKASEQTEQEKLTQLVQAVLSRLDSPLPAVTIAAFKLSHRDFDIAGYLAVVGAESTFGRNTDKNNPGSIKWVNDSNYVWHALATSVSPKGYCRYKSLYDGQRATIRCFYDLGYNDVLKSGDVRRFTLKWFGDKEGADKYTSDVRWFRKKVVSIAAGLGERW
jgi:hypothetical protein